MDRRSFLTTTLGLSIGACAAPATHAAPAPLSADERAGTIAARRPPRRARPVVAVLGAPHGAETTDLMIPYAVLRASGLAEVVVVSPSSAILPLMPALNVRPQMALAAFDARWPDGADYVIVPAMHRPDDAVVLEWIRTQSKAGALVCGICAGALVLSQAGLIAGRRATTHWFRIGELQRANPTMHWARDRRFVVDRGVATTTGVSASIPFALTLVEAIGGREAASGVAARMGVQNWGADHDSAAYSLSGDALWTAVRNRATSWPLDRIGIPVADGVDDAALALVSDIYSSTFRSQAFAIAESAAPIKTRLGLGLVPTAPAGMTRVLPPLGDVTPLAALNAALSDIKTRYGRSTANLAALMLEYSWSR
ncbi:MAG: transcriptional regulator [Alphaproteobacteria bacterium]|nr:transcriptional regulator [Alphaproteobacteria bacterium]